MLVVARIDADLAEVVRTLRADVVVVGAHLCPPLSGVVRAVDLAAVPRWPPASTCRRRWRARGGGTWILVFDHRVQDVRIAVEDVEANPADPALGKPVAQPHPASSAVGRLVDS